MNRNRILRWTSLAFLLGALGPGLLAPLPAQRLKAVRAKTPVQAVRATTSFSFPGRAEDLTSGKYWYRGKKIHGSGVQKLGYDLGAVRYDRAEKSWSQYKPGVDPATDRDDTKNSDWLIYGQPVYAVAAGEVTGCWRNAPENSPGDLHPGRKSDPKTIPGGGNMLWVDDGAGDRVLYAHFQPGSVPKALCPHNDAFLDPSQSGQSEVPEGSRPKVKRGQFLGVVGNAGQSHESAPAHSSGKKTASPCPFRSPRSWPAASTRTRTSRPPGNASNGRLCRPVRSPSRPTIRRV